MLETLKIKNVSAKENTLKIQYTFNGSEWHKYLIGDTFFCEYGENIQIVPESILVIPFLCNILPIAWVYNLNIEVNEIDYSFYKSLDSIKMGYEKMYPDFKFNKGLNLRCKKIVKNSYKNNKFAVLFSGGVDAVTTTFRHLDENPDIITVFGSDIKLSDLEGIENVKKANSAFSKKLNLDFEEIYSNFRTFLNENTLGTHDYIKKHNYGWWHEFQHGIGLISLVAPLSYIRGYKTVYIASSYHKSQWGQYTCASDPIIDNKLKYGNTDTYHDGYELTRQDKIEYICNFTKNNNIKPNLRVCWESSGGKNCCNCEKCRRTYLAIITEKHDPSKYGLDFTKKQHDQAIKWLRKNLKYNFSNAAILYRAIQERFNENYSLSETPEDLKWFRDIKIAEKKYPKYRKYMKAIGQRIKRFCNIK